jgi:polyhydroxybutyrate depolymerase
MPLRATLALGWLFFIATTGCRHVDETQPGTPGDGSSDTGGDTHTGSDGDTGTDVDSDADTDDTPTDPPCDPALSEENAGNHDMLTTFDGIVYNVRAPDDYDASNAYPLIVVYAPAGADQDLTESFTGLTPDALASGYIIGYAEHVSPSSTANVQKLAEVANEIPLRWCIDPERVFLTGHSDGGSTATVIAIFEMLDTSPASIAPSASGTNADWFDSVTCPASLPVMIMHSSDDLLFPGFGLDARDFWVECNACNSEPSETLPDGCEVHDGCADAVEVRYCEGIGSHGAWPGLNDSMISFFDLF